MKNFCRMKFGKRENSEKTTPLQLYRHHDSNGFLLNSQPFTYLTCIFLSALLAQWTKMPLVRFLLLPCNFSMVSTDWVFVSFFPCSYRTVFGGGPCTLLATGQRRHAYFVLYGVRNNFLHYEALICKS